MYLEAHFLGGVNITTACAEACALAARLRCDIHFKFNDVRCMAFPHSYPEDLEAAWWEATESKSQHKITAGHPRPTHPTSMKSYARGSSGPAGDASDSGRLGDSNDNAGVTPAPTLSDQP